jgi:hypothetical protein
VSWLGARGVEARLSERLEVSSTAMSSAPPVLGKEGLLKPRGRHGYAHTVLLENCFALTQARFQFRSRLNLVRGAAACPNGCRLSLSTGACLDFCVLRHSMSTERDMYATQDDEESDSSIIGAAA